MPNHKQIENMKHCIGISAEQIKRRKYEAYRNYFTTPDDDTSWDEIVSLGYAKKAKFERGTGKNPQIYHLTQEGMGFLSRLLIVKITEMDQAVAKGVDR